MAFETRPYPDFSWSQSRDATFKECRRKYFFHYYAAHNGWFEHADEFARVAYRLKQMANLHVVLGSAIHEMAHEVILKAHQGLTTSSVEEWVQKIKNRLNEAYVSSKQVDRWRLQPKKSTMLHEMYYGGSLSTKTVEQIKVKIEPCVRNIFSSDTYQELVNNDSIQIVEAENMKTTAFESDQLYVIPDLVYQRKDGTFVIVDWKTGKEYEQNEDQTLLYAMYANEHYGVPLEKIEIRLEYLLLNSSKILIPTAERMQQTKQWIRASLGEMKSLLENQLLNKPQPDTFFQATPSAFSCKSCNFREICNEAL
jgi:hypothetical protein